MHQTLDAFSDRAAFRDNAMTRLDPRVKLAVALAGIVVVLCARSVAVPLAAFGACLVSLIAVGTPWRVVMVRVTSPLLVAIILLLLQALLGHPASAGAAAPLWQWPLGRWTLTITRDGLDAGLLMGSRVLGSMSILVLLGSVTPAFKVFAALRWAGMPRTMVDLAMLMYRYIFGLVEQVMQVRGAQRVRLGYVGAARSLQSTGNLMGTVVLRALDQADRTHDAMSVRLYDGHLRMADLEPLPARGWLVLAGSVAAMAAFIVLHARGSL